MAIVPGGFDQDAPQMGVAGASDAAAPGFGAAGVCSVGTRPTNAITAGADAKRRGSRSPSVDDRLVLASLRGPETAGSAP